jgi:hypothetical protein
MEPDPLKEEEWVKEAEDLAQEEVAEWAEGHKVSAASASVPSAGSPSPTNEGYPATR